MSSKFFRVTEVSRTFAYCKYGQVWPGIALEGKHTVSVEGVVIDRGAG
jgi:hypothetical protein